MRKLVEFQPLDNESPSEYADRLGVLYTKSVSSQHKKERGQFFTPKEIAHFMADLTKKDQDKLKILDPGCGTAILSTALIETLAKQKTDLKEIELTVYETDKDILPFTQEILNYTAKWLKGNKIKFTSNLNTHDFIVDNKDCFEQANMLFSEPQAGMYDIVISNPPYFKISKEDKRTNLSY